MIRHNDKGKQTDASSSTWIMDPCLGAGPPEVSPGIPEVVPQKLLLPLTAARKFRAGSGTERDLPSASAAIP